ncbi:MAG: PocR ligand-binding domain-containing protein [Clostridia bacterium]|jgi:ligand-binding sensor protein|nr:PocR ligand-binding domain-containing protein [Clostridia bacterium]MCI2001109.1 PocR ligand-binding domain-containing protein [Clostridia bacterium]MCI2015765.1 PocR ligand-binding domain-containing protein [Clostridia bacterium]
MIKFLDDGNIDMDVLEIGDIVDIQLLQNFQDNFAIGMNCASVTVDRNGNPVTRPSSYTKFCSEFVNKSMIGQKRCAESHHQMGLEAARTGRPYIGQCHAGLIDFAAPIIINNELIGTVLGGQILADKPEEDLCRKVAREIAVNENELVKAVNGVTISKRQNITAAAEVLFIVVNALAKNGYTRIKLENIAKQLSDKFVEISATLEELATASQTVTEQQQKLNNEIDKVGKFNEKINDILKSITKMATNTRILGINSSIEAAHAGEAGKGFAIVAREIQTLAESSKEISDEILQFTSQIKVSIDTTIDHSQMTLDTTQAQSSEIEEVANNVQQMVHLTYELDNMMKSVE